MSYLLTLLAGIILGALGYPFLKPEEAKIIADLKAELAKLKTL